MSSNVQLMEKIRLVSLHRSILYTDNPYKIMLGNVFFMHMILMDSDSNLAMNLGETYLVTENGNERLGKQKLDLVVLWRLDYKIKYALI